MADWRVGILAGLLLTACAVPAAAEGPHTGVDPSVRPGADFYGYSNAVWMRAMKLPEGVSSIDSTSMLRVVNAQRVRDIVARAVAAAAANRRVRPEVRKLAAYHASRLDVARIDARGLTPLAPDLAAIAAVADRRALAMRLGQSLRLDDGSNLQTESLWGLWVHQGFHDPDHYAVHFVQGGLGLAEPDDYRVQAPDRDARRAAYRAYVASLLGLAGFDRPEARAAGVLALETAIARTHASRADTDDVFKTDNDWTSADFTRKAPGLDWPAFFAAAGLDSATHFVVWQPASVIGGADLVATAPLGAWKDYLSFHLIDHYAAVLPRAVRDARRTFAAALTGMPPPPEPSPEEQALTATQAMFADAIGRLYIERYFPPPARAAAERMVGNIRSVLRDRLGRLDWLAPDTRTKALAKLAALRIGLGYPDIWTDYESLAIAHNDAFGNLQRGEAFEYRRQLARLRRRVDPSAWPDQLHPQMVGAILDISPNSMEFAAGLLQPPYFDPAGDVAANYSSAGAGIAHEISHSFDEVGNLYDDRGRLGSWWTTDDLARYRAALAPLAKQLDGCGHGQQIVGESSADLAGLSVAHEAYRRALDGKPDRVKDGLTGEQRFFVAFAQRWRRLQTPASLQRQIATDTHAPPECRGNLVRNVAGWYQAFGVGPGDALYLEPGARFGVW